MGKMDSDLRRLDAARRAVRRARHGDLCLFWQYCDLAARLCDRPCRLVRLGYFGACHRLVGSTFRHRAAKLVSEPARASSGQPLLNDSKNGDRVSPFAVARSTVGAALPRVAVPLNPLHLLRDSGDDLRLRLLPQIPRARVEVFAVAGAIGAGAVTVAQNAASPPFPLQYAACHLVVDAPRR